MRDSGGGKLERTEGRVVGSADVALRAGKMSR